MENSYEPTVEVKAAEAACSAKEEGLQPFPAACSNAFYQTDLISVPIKVAPYAKAGPCSTVCCGSPIITVGNDCQGEAGRTCEFTITQKICVKLPLRFGAAVKVEHARIQCGGLSETECDCQHTCPRECDCN